MHPRVIAVIACMFVLAQMRADETASSPQNVQVLGGEAVPALDALFAPRKHGFLGADGATTVQLPDGRVLWVFADTVVGHQRDGKRSGPMIRNSIAIQPAHSARPEDVRFYWRTPDRVPEAFFPSETDDEAIWYWPGCGVEANGNVYLFLMKMTKRSGASEVFAFQAIGCTLFRIHNPADNPDNWKLSHVDLTTATEHFNINAAALVEGDYAYLLGHSDGTIGEHEKRSAILGRIPIAALDTPDPGKSLEFWSQDQTWRNKSDNLQTLFAPAGTESSLQYDSVRKRYIAVVLPPFTSDLCITTAKELTGPWSPPQKVYDIPQVNGPAGKGLFAYTGRAHPELSSGPDELIITYVVNADDIWTMFGRLDIYYPRFVRVKLGSAR